MSILKAILASLFEAIVGGVVQGVGEKRRDDALQKLGYSEADRYRLAAQNAAMKAARKIYDAPDPTTLTDTLRDL